MRRTPVPVTAMSAPASRPIRSALMMLGASALIAMTTMFAKALGQGVGGEALHPMQVSAGRFAFGFLTLLLASAILRPRIRAPRLPIHAARSLAGWGGVTLMFAAVARIPAADATAISFLNPVVAMVLAILFLGETVGRWRWLAAAIALLGALVLLRPGMNGFQPAAFLALAAACVMGVEIVLIKFLSGREAPLQILLINNAIGCAIALAAASFVWQWPTAMQWAMLAGIGAVMVSAQSLYIQSMRAADASYAVPFAYSTLVFAAFYDTMLFGVVPDAISLAGGALILGGAVLLAWREGLAARRARRGTV
jgi:drug/metabolite transporter (DMT)-like permease